MVRRLRAARRLRAELHDLWSKYRRRALYHAVVRLADADLALLSGWRH